MRGRKRPGENGDSLRAQGRRGDAGGECESEGGVAAADCGVAADSGARLLRVLRRVPGIDRFDGKRGDSGGSADQRRRAVGRGPVVVRSAVSERSRIDESDLAPEKCCNIPVLVIHNDLTVYLIVKGIKIKVN